ncbi:hypothetical protein VTO42DRAFT_324 [Malbranchea cinnamomea]
MLGLDAYSSSSEDEVTEEKPVQPIQPKGSPKKAPVEAQSQDVEPSSVEEPVRPQPQPSSEADRPLVGPFRPPEHETEPLPLADESHPPSRRSSPFSATRALIRDMTLPPIPNLNIPPSPPGSPDPVTNKKFEHFLSLKKQGVHFNQKLASSSSLRNPSLLSKMMEHAGIDEKAQYATSLPTDIWDVSTLPPWGYKEELNKSQQEIRRRLEERKPAERGGLEFVPASRTGSAESSRDGTPAGGRWRQTAAERVMSGLSRETKSSHATGEAVGRRTDLERRSRIGQKRDRSRSPLGRRRRSRSR